MFPSDKDTERIIPRKQMDFFKIAAQLIAVVFLLFYLTINLFVDQFPILQQINYQELIIILIVMVLLVPGGITLFGKWLQAKKWLSLADEIGFQAESSKRFSIPKLHGTYRGHHINVEQTSQSRGRSRVYYTNVHVLLNQPVDASIQMQKRSLTNFNQFKIGDEEIDKKYITKTNNQKLLDHILRNRRLRQGLLQIGERARSRSLSINQTSLKYFESGETGDTEYLRNIIGFLSELAHTIERHDQFS